MIHLGDVCKIAGTKVPPVECLSFGAPCQDLSQAGKRKGLHHSELGDEETTRSGLFFEAIRLIKEMRSIGYDTGRTDELERFPRYCIYENVPGALSSNKGEDFRLVLEYLARIGEPDASIPMPEKGKWANAGCIAGVGWSLAWRIGNALNFGVPQRRRRVCVLLSLDERERSTDQSNQDEALSDIRAPRAAEILFERQGRGGNDIPQFAPWQSLARYSEDGAGERSNAVMYQDACGALMANTHPGSYSGQDAYTGMLVGEKEAVGADLYAGDVTGDVTMTLTAARNDDHHIPCVIQPAVYDARGNGDGEIVPTLTGGHQATISDYTAVVVEPIGVDSYNLAITGDKAMTIRAKAADSEHVPCVIEPRRCWTLDEKCGNTYCWEDQANTIAARDYKQPQIVAYGFDAGASRDVGVAWYEERSKELTNGTCPGHHNHVVIGEEQTDYNVKYIVRRLTPLECERLQAFPDNWTVLPEKTEMTDEEYAEWQSIRRTWAEMNGKTYKPAKDKAAMLKWYNKMIKADSARYKALGNSIAVCQWYRLFWKMRPYLPEHPTLGSLFDGIGGFPLAWESLYGKGSALWASEVEPFPIAVTKYHFSEEDNDGADGC